MFKPYHSNDSNYELNINKENLLPVEAIVNFNKAGDFRVEYIRFSLENQERVTLKMDKMIRQLDRKAYMLQEYEYTSNRSKRLLRLYYFTNDSAFYIENE